MAHSEIKSIFQADYSKMVDPFKMMAAFKMPGFDIGSLMEMQRKNVEMIIAINQGICENMQSFMQHQAELMRSGFVEATGLMNSVMPAPALQDKALRQAENLNTAANKYTAKARGITETIAKGNGLGS